MAFYAVEYAYGSTVVNNGPRADRVLKFTQKRLQVAWVQAGSDYADQPGYRSIIGARNPLVRKADYLEDGDIEAYEVIARERVSNSPKLLPYWHELIGYDWCQFSHWQTVATAPERSLIEWAQTVREQAAEAVQ
jgi:hypothetical protein